MLVDAAHMRHVSTILGRAGRRPDGNDDAIRRLSPEQR
jgi:hypothetical protein